MPKYSEGNQHALIAWQLAIMAYDLECGTFIRRPLVHTFPSRITAGFVPKGEGRRRRSNIFGQSSGSGRGLAIKNSGRAINL